MGVDSDCRSSSPPKRATTSVEAMATINHRRGRIACSASLVVGPAGTDSDGTPTAGALISFCTLEPDDLERSSS